VFGESLLHCHFIHYQACVNFLEIHSVCPWYMQLNPVIMTGLYNTLPVESTYSVVPINLLLLTITFYSSVRMTLVYNDTK